MRISVTRIFLHTVLPLIAGALIYLFSRPHNWLIVTMGIKPLSRPAGDLPVWAQWLTGSGPDACWAYSLTSALLFWDRAAGHRRYRMLLFALGLVITQECLQLLFPRQFTFDPADLVAAIGGSALSWVLNRKYV